MGVMSDDGFWVFVLGVLVKSKNKHHMSLKKSGVVFKLKAKEKVDRDRQCKPPIRESKAFDLKKFWLQIDEKKKRLLAKFGWFECDGVYEGIRVNKADDRSGLQWLPSVD